MPYPPAPWKLKGYIVHTLQLVEIERARPFVPPGLKVVQIIPGKTQGAIYLANYTSGSVFVYHELIVSPALTRLRNLFGFWVSHIYVDDPDSMAGGREIWGLPKELAQFDWALEERGEVSVWQADQLLCRLQCGTPRVLQSLPMRLPSFLPTISQLGERILWFKGNFHSRLGTRRGVVEVPETSPFAALGLSRPALTFHYLDMSSVANAPRAIAESPVMVSAHKN